MLFVTAKHSAANVARPSFGALADVDAIEADIDALKRAWSESRRRRDRNGVYVFLDPVYETALRWMKRRQLPPGLRTDQMYGDLFSVFITKGSGGTIDPKTRSKWSRAMRLAHFERRRANLSALIRRKGGINACASLFTQMNRGD
ncbi:MAG TPA: hypothetical protein VHD59_12575 [Pseudolabrys sp.]|jgi:hypothetical protein|nr:hypothetical protein [Pseudolabrys sp.]